MSAQCAICSMHVFTERAHVRAKRSTLADTQIFNLVPLCPTCHTYFDQNLITLHPDWRCWIFSDIVEKKTTTGSRFRNHLQHFIYSYPVKPIAHIIDKIDRRYIEWNNVNEFCNRADLAPNLFFQVVGYKLRQNGQWDEENQRPVVKYLTVRYAHTE